MARFYSDGGKATSINVDDTLHGIKKKTLPRWAAYLRDRNPDCNKISSREADSYYFVVHLDLVTNDTEAQEAVDAVGLDVIQAKNGSYYGELCKLRAE